MEKKKKESKSLAWKIYGLQQNIPRKIIILHCIDSTLFSAKDVPRIWSERIKPCN